MDLLLPSLGKLGSPLFGMNSTANHTGNPNSTDPSSSPFPADMMETLLAGAGRVSPLMQLFIIAYRFLAEQLGIDPSIIITSLGALWALSKVVSQVWSYAEHLVDQYFMCAMYVSEDDAIYNYLMKWLSQHASIRTNQYLMAQTVWKSAWDDEDGLEESLDWTDAGEGDGNKYLNFSNEAARSAPRYVPAMGRTSFWDKGTYFKVYRRKESLMSTSGYQAMKDQEEIKISCYGRSIAPIKRLLADAKALYYDDTSQKTTIFRPRVKDQRRDWSMWQQVARRPVRPMQTVVLDPKEKRDVLQDINDYLHPATPKWYAARGIPLRRGYLFHGPPGTGKTSFSFALAGVFGIDIYVISLQDVNITEEDLASLFTRLPRRCVILLEDIDTAGLRRPDDDESEDTKEKDKDKEGEEDKKESGEKKLTNGETIEKEASTKKKSSEATESKTKKSKKSKKKDSDSDGSESDASDSSSSESEATKRRSRKRALASKNRRRGGGSGRDDKKGKKNATPESISLSGLLNAIDGVASHEGRVLIMTTNKPESLDEALIRPGRVDMQVAFSNATSQQAGELFRRMYEGSTPLSEAPSRPGGKGAAASSLSGPSRFINVGRPGADAKAVAQAQDAADMLWHMRNIGILDEDLAAGELEQVASKFGKLVPEKTLSPAEIQGFLLKRKRSPRKALAEADEWVKATVKQKEEKSKVKTVQ